MKANVVWTAPDAIRATGGHCAGDWQATGVCSDSRRIALGDLFVALKGPHYDGHEFVGDALRRGAVAGLVSRRPGDVPENAPLLTVGDTLAALERLARAARRRTPAKIIAITGSVGKSGTKEALRHALSGQGPVHASPASFNNHLGVPLSLAAMPSSAAFGAFEIGMNHRGEITPLTRLVRPHVAVITAIAPVHLAFFDSVADIADAKAEIFAGVEPGGAAVINQDTPFFERLAAACAQRGIDRTIGFGAHQEAAVRLIDEAGDPGGSRVTADIEGRRIRYRVGVPGQHWVMNSLAVLAATLGAGADTRAAAERLANLPLLPGRGVFHRVNLPDGSFTLIDDSYNANPESMMAAIAVLGNAERGTSARLIAVLGDMLELGANAPEHHAGLAAPIRRAGVDRVHTAGSEMLHLHDALPGACRGGHATRAEDLIPLLVRGAVRDGDVVLVKGSFGSRMGQIVTALQALGEDRQPGSAGNG